ncbi:3'-5' exonuclease [uncultured Thiohalocapsa sp.]|uniref:3'-5' exonuclease n=1 Tax=uncultured Thiohalocapsa sp. TaxID=768990 RepID=UPI0025F9EC43|nr:3'-5' exonuclease [uncultured Thiohalocapsa sp.]
MQPPEDFKRQFADTISPEQQSVLDLATGHHLVQAPPGSGKTELLALRLERVLDSGMPAECCACLTFTSRAARNMATRLGDRCRGAFVGNLHSLASRYLGGPDGAGALAGILDEEDTGLFLDQAVADVLKGWRPQSDAELPTAKTIERLRKKPQTGSAPGRSTAAGIAFGSPALEPSQLRKAALRFIPWVDQVCAGCPDAVIESARRLFHASTSIRFDDPAPPYCQALLWVRAHYRRQKRELRVLDFDDLLLNCWRQLDTQPDAPRFSWIQVDEAQDLNDLQWEILQRILAPEGHLVVYADPQQAIFSFMGASYERLQQVRQRLELHELSINFRSLPFLLEILGQYARQELRADLDWHSLVAGELGRNDLLTMAFANEDDEEAYLSNQAVPKILEQHQGSVALLVRTNRQAARLSASLYHAGLDHFTVSSQDLFRLKIGKDFMAWLQSLARPEAPLPWIRLLQLCGAARSLKDAHELLRRMRECAILPHWLLGDRSGESALPWLDLIAMLEHGRLVIFDTETTGTNVAEDDILQIAAVELIDGRPRRELVVYLRSDRDIGDSVTVHGITPEQLAEKGMDRREGLSRIVDFLGDAPLVAHNLVFDRFMLDANLARVGIEPPDTRGRYCSLEMARALDPNAPSHRLGDLLERHGLEGDNSHDALDDVRATLPLLRLVAKLGRERRAKAEAFVAEISDVLRRLDAPLPRAWLRRRAAWLEKTDFKALFDELMRELPQDAYEPGHRRDLEDKLLRHMQRTCPPTTLQDLLQQRLPPYLLYREPDLILDEDRLVVSTVHRAKGLQFDSVLIPGCTDNNYPSWFAANDGEEALREEARLLYVAMSRSRRQLVISWPKSTSNDYGRVFNAIPSRFLASIRPRFRHYDIPAERIRRNRDHFTCPSCGRSFKFDGSRQHDRRCFACGHVPGG